MDHESLEQEILERIESADSNLRPVFLLMVKLTTVVGEAVKAQAETARVQQVHSSFIETQCAQMSEAKGGGKVLKAAGSIVAFLLLTLQSVGVYEWREQRAELKGAIERLNKVELEVATHRASTEGSHGNGNWASK